MPPELIAQEPAPRRDESRLLALIGSRTRHLRFREMVELLAPGDLLVLNDTRVLAARLYGRLPGGGRAEALLLAEKGTWRWSALVRPGRKLGMGATIDFEDACARVEAIEPDGERVLAFSADPVALMARSGVMPLPPYIRSLPADPERYQTVYAANPGAVAAPTAGLHFTPELLADLAARGVGAVALTLHVGPGTFRPVRDEDLGRHHMHAETFTIGQATADAIAAARGRGGRVVAVGTTALRALETVADGMGRVHAHQGETELFVRPGHVFKATDGLITNFHLPRSTLLMLVAAFADDAGLGGLERIRAAYAEAVARRYRFFSFGDAMILLPR